MSHGNSSCCATSFSFFAILLWIAALLCFVPGVDLPQLGIAILTVVLVNGLFAFLQEYKSDRALEMLQRMIAQSRPCIRDGDTSEIDAAAWSPAMSSCSKKATWCRPTAASPKPSKSKSTTPRSPANRRRRAATNPINRC